MERSRPLARVFPFPFPLTGAFEASTTALLVIDFQRDFVEEGGYMSQCGYDVTPLAEPMPRVAAVLKSTGDSAPLGGGLSVALPEQMDNVDALFQLHKISTSEGEALRSLRGAGAQMDVDDVMLIITLI